ALAHELAQDAGEALLGDAQDAEELADAHLRVPANEINHAMMRATEAVARQHGVGLGGEGAIGVKQKLDALPYLVLGGTQRGIESFYVRHVDIFLAGLLHGRQGACEPHFKRKVTGRGTRNAKHGDSDTTV